MGTRHDASKSPIVRRLTAVRALVLLGLLSGCLGELPEGGVSRQPVIGGRPASADEIHSTVAIVTTADGATVCTGTLIAPTVVLTAAHCLVHADPVDWERVTPMAAHEIAVSVGLLDATSPDPSTLRAAAAVVPHEGYPGEFAWTDPDALGQDHDIGVIILSSPVHEIPPAPVLPVAGVDATLFPGAEIVIEGYGVTNLRSDDGRSVLNIASTSFQRRTNHELLAGSDGMPDTCYGDSGGPAYVTDGGGGLSVVGVTSRAAGSTALECGGGGIYTLAPAYDSWFRSTTGGAYPPPVAPPDPEPEPDAPPPDPPPPLPDEPDSTPGDPSGPGMTEGETVHYYGGCSAAAGRGRGSVARLLGALL